MPKKQDAACYIVGNWKMYKTIGEALEFLDTITPLVEKTSASVWLAAPYTALKSMSDKGQSTHIVIGAQNMNDATEGAFTGEVCALMLKDAGAKFVLIGHSERRRLYHETDELINKKVTRALEAEITPILCIGETYEEHHEDRTEEVLTRQLTTGLDGIDPKDVVKCIIAYEPVWAIGSGLAADPASVQKIHMLIRKIVGEKIGSKEADILSILYGGSVSKDNAEKYIQTEGINGLLIGSASLHPETFAKIISLCAK